MQRYHFNIEDGVQLKDEQGTELASLDTARNMAVDVLTETLRGKPEMLWRHGQLGVTVTNDHGLTLFVVQVTSTDAPVLGDPRPRRG